MHDLAHVRYGGCYAEGLNIDSETDFFHCIQAETDEILQVYLVIVQ